MHVVLQPSPSVAHRYRVTLPNKRTVDFGKKDVLYYSDHGDPRLMRAQLLRRGAVIPKELRVERDLGEIHRGMLKLVNRQKRIGKISFGQNSGKDGYYILTLV